MRRRRLAVRACHSDDVERERRMAVHRRGGMSEAIDDARNADDGRAADDALRELDPFLGEDGARAAGDRLADEGAPVVLLSAPDDEDIASRDATRVLLNAEDARGGFAFHGDLAGDLALELGDRQALDA